MPLLIKGIYDDVDGQGDRYTYVRDFADGGPHVLPGKGRGQRQNIHSDDVCSYPLTKTMCAQCTRTVQVRLRDAPRV